MLKYTCICMSPLLPANLRAMAANLLGSQHALCLLDSGAWDQFNQKQRNMLEILEETFPVIAERYEFINPTIIVGRSLDDLRLQVEVEPKDGAFLPDRADDGVTFILIRDAYPPADRLAGLSWYEDGVLKEYKYEEAHK